MALQIALVGTLAARFERYAPLFLEETWEAEAVVLGALLGVYALLFVSGVAIAASVYVPRNPRTGGSLIYFYDIGAMPFESFRVQASGTTPGKIECQLLHQIHTVSRIVSSKMRRVRLAYSLSVPSVLLWLSLLAWGSV